MATMRLEISGMSCGHCVSAVRTALAALPGVRVERVEVGLAQVSYEPAEIRPEAMAEAVEEAGYAVRRQAA